MGPSRARAALLLLLSGCGTHTVTVFAPVADVPPKTEVVAAVEPGKVTTFPRGAAVDHGIVRRDGKVLARLAPSDLLVVEAGNRAVFGPIEVTRQPEYEFYSLLGIVVIIGGVMAAWGAAGAACPFGPFSSTDCIATVGLLGTLASAAAGVPLIALGVHGSLVVTTSASPRASAVTLAPTDVTVRF